MKRLLLIAALVAATAYLGLAVTYTVTPCRIHDGLPYVEVVSILGPPDTILDGSNGFTAEWNQTSRRPHMIVRIYEGHVLTHYVDGSVCAK